MALDQMRQERQLLGVGEVEEIFRPFGTNLRRLGGRPGRLYGNDSMLMYIEAIDEVKTFWDEWLESQPDPIADVYESGR